MITSDNNKKRISSKPISSDEANPATQKISALREWVIPTFQMEQQTLELYYMKAIALLQKHNLMSSREARQLILKTPTQINHDKHSHLLTISQHLVPLPGQNIKVSAVFGMESRTLNYNIFLSDHLSTENRQTGAPHPLQHNGWALPEVLIPKSLHRPNCLTHFPKLWDAKRTFAQALLPNAPLTEKAKLLLTLKREAFNTHKEEFCESHRTLALALGAAASPKEVPDNYNASVEVFFSHLASVPLPYDALAQIHEKVATTWTITPYESLESAVLRGEFQTLDQAQAYLRDQIRIAQTTWTTKVKAAWDSKEKEQLYALDYGMSLGQLLAPSMENLILQQFSEAIDFAPPPLDLFAKKIQTDLYVQLWEFHHELDLEPKETDFFRRLSHLLEQELTLFNAKSLENLHWEATATVFELEAYYNPR